MYMKTFVLQLVITEACNLNCKYCYMKKANTYMTKEILDKIYNQLYTLLYLVYGFEDYSVTYFGGEPLLNWDIIEYGNSLFSKDSKCKNQIVISNGLLLDEYKVKYIKDNHLGFSWSFDGLGNNTNRVDFENNSTYKAYIDKLSIIKQVSNKSCKVMISPSVVPIMNDIFNDLIDNLGIECPDFTIVRDDIWTKNDIQIFKQEVKKLADNFISRFKKGKIVSNGFFVLAIKDSLMYMKHKMKRPFTCYSGTDGIAIMPSGDIYPCARCGSEKLYKLFDNNKLIQSNFNIFNNEYTDLRNMEECKNCSIYNICNTGCKVNQIHNNNNPLNSVCELTKSIYNEAFRIHEELKSCSNWLEVIRV